MSYQHRVECEQLRHKLNAALQRAEAAEAKLAELEKQEPRYQIQKKPSYGRESVWIDVASQEEAETNVIHGYRWRMVYDAPAPAADLADLVPDDAPEKVRYEMEMATGLILDEDDSQALWCLCRAAILRNIEEAK